MASSILTLSDDNLLAEYIPLDTFKGVSGQKLGIGPDMLALLIRDGEIAQSTVGANISIGGLWRTIQNSLLGRHNIRLLIVDLTPFNEPIRFDGMTQDYVPVAGELTINLQVNPERPINVLGLMKDHVAVTKSEVVLTHLAPYLRDRVLQASIGRVAAAELRGNIDLQNKVQAELMTEVQRLAGDCGLLVRATTLNWASNENETAAIKMRAKIREIEREGEATVLSTKTKTNLERLRSELRTVERSIEEGDNQQRVNWEMQEIEIAERKQAIADAEHRRDMEKVRELREHKNSTPTVFQTVVDKLYPAAAQMRHANQKTASVARNISSDGVKGPAQQEITEDFGEASDEEPQTSEPPGAENQNDDRTEYFRQLLQYAKQRTDLHANVHPARANFVGAGGGRAGLLYCYYVWQKKSAVRFYIDDGSIRDPEKRKAHNKNWFDRLLSQKGIIETAFGTPLHWERLDDSLGCYVEKLVADEGFKDRENWQSTIERMVDAMIC